MAGSTGAAARLMRLVFEKTMSNDVKSFNQVLNKCQFVSCELGRCVALLKVEPEHCNHNGTLHGGLSAVLVDSISTLALVTDDESSLSKLGVSVDMHMSYMKAAKLGDEVIIDARVTKRGRTLAFLDVELRAKNTNDLLVKGSHTKFIG